MLTNDQAASKEFSKGKISKSDLIKIVDAHTKIVATIFGESGIAQKDLDGENTYKAMLALVLHSGDVELMQSYLDAHEKFGEGSIDISDRAVVTDKICVMLGKSQIYGTQYKIKDQSIIFAPIEDEKNVDSRRADLGLDPIGHSQKLPRETTD